MEVSESTFLDVIFSKPISADGDLQNYFHGLIAKGTLTAELAHRNADNHNGLQNKITFVNALQNVYRIDHIRTPMSEIQNEIKEPCRHLSEDVTFDLETYFQLQTDEGQPPEIPIVKGQSQQNTTQQQQNTDVQTEEQQEDSLIESIPEQVMEKSQPTRFIEKTLTLNMAFETYSYDGSQPGEAIEKLLQDFEQYQQKSEPPTTCQLTKDDFIWLKKLGKGHFGEVSLVVHKTTGFTCALKTISKKTIISQKVEDQVVRELKILSKCRHPNIAQMYGFFSDVDNLYILQELCTGGELFDLLRKKRRVTEDEAAYLIKQLLQGLRYLQVNCIIHRDIKPENILLENGVVKICDMGWAVYSIGMRTSRCGTPLYQSPEVIQGNAYDQKVDVWATAAITYELITGNIPFKVWCEEDLQKVVQEQLSFPTYLDISDPVKHFIEGGMVKSPKERSTVLDLLLHPFLAAADIMTYHQL